MNHLPPPYTNITNATNSRKQRRNGFINTKVQQLLSRLSMHLERLFKKNYLSSNTVLYLDLLASVAASSLAVLLTRCLVPPSGVGATAVWWWLGGSLAFSWLFFTAFRTQKSVIRYSTPHSISKITIAVFFKCAALALLSYLVPRISLSAVLWVGLLFDLLLSFAMLVLMRVTMIGVYNALRNRYGNKDRCERILVYGTDDKSVAVITRLATSTLYKVAGFIHYSDERKPKNYKISEHPIMGFRSLQDLERIRKKHQVDAVLFAKDSDVRAEQDRLVKYCTTCHLKVLIVPSIDEMVDGKLSNHSIRQIKIEDLLGREEIKVSIREIRESFCGKTVMVTGAAGSIGAELCRQIASFGVKRLVLYDNAETPMHNLRLELEDSHPELDFVPIIGDVRHPARLEFAFSHWQPEVVFHAAAYKHVPLMEENPCEAVLVNVAGTRNVADKCIEHNVEKMVMISTDKAVNPTNIMGCTKRLAEIYVQALGLAVEQGRHPGRTQFITTRFGNVLGSNGSVIPRFREQIAKGGPVTVTHPEITRFFMTIPEACRLVMESATLGTSNRIFVFDMGESVKIRHLAERMIAFAGLVPGKDIKIEYTGLRPGEKLYEEVLSDEENTTPTHHHHIRIAKVREYDYDEALAWATQLEDLSRRVEIPAMVRLMKQAVPEFKSKNSKFEAFDEN